MKIYKDSKELPFLIYKKIMQTGDFFYMIKGYEDGDIVEPDPEKQKALKTDLEQKFNALITEFVFAINNSTEELTNQANYLRALMNQKLHALALEIIDHYHDIEITLAIHRQTAYEEIYKIIETEVLPGIKIPRSKDFDELKQNIIDKIHVYEFNIEKYKSIIEKEVKGDSSEEVDLDKQLINVCLMLEIPFPDESKITLYQFSILIERAVEKSKSLEKINSRP